MSGAKRCRQGVRGRYAERADVSHSGLAKDKGVYRGRLALVRSARSTPNEMKKYVFGEGDVCA